jgi:hypothetical protein
MLGLGAEAPLAGWLAPRHQVSSSPAAVVVSCTHLRACVLLGPHSLLCYEQRSRFTVPFELTTLHCRDDDAAAARRDGIRAAQESLRVAPPLTPS